MLFRLNTGTLPENINTDKARISLEKYNTALIAGATARAACLEQNQADKIKAGFDREKLG
jgi:hypothetical protein